MTVAVADIANRTYRALWLLLGGTYVHDWSAADPEATIQRRRLLQGRRMSAARWVMATGVRPLGEILARLPAHADQPNGPTAGMCFEQYGEFRVPAQPDARLNAALDELAAIAADLDRVATEPTLAARWAGPRLASLAADMRMIRNRLRGVVPPPSATVSSRRTRVAGCRSTSPGGTRYASPPAATPTTTRAGYPWQFAFPGEPDLDRVLRFQAEGTFLRRTSTRTSESGSG